MGNLMSCVLLKEVEAPVSEQPMAVAVLPPVRSPVQSPVISPVQTIPPPAMNSFEDSDLAKLAEMWNTRPSLDGDFRLSH